MATATMIAHVRVDSRDQRVGFRGGGGGVDRRLCVAGDGDDGDLDADDLAAAARARRSASRRSSSGSGSGGGGVGLGIAAQRIARSRRGSANVAAWGPLSPPG
jgi:hypothetical protein